MTHGTGSTRGVPPRVLVITHDLDPTADYVLRELNARGVPFWRTDVADFPQRITMRAELRPDGAWGGAVVGPLRGIDLSELTSVWWRKPTTFRFPGSMSGPEQRFAAGQAKRGFAGVLGSLPQVLWVNRPERNADCTKPAQLTAAAESGLQVPATLVTNDPGAVRDFADRCRGRIVTKVLGGIVHTENGQRGQIYTTRVPADRWDDPRVALTAHLYQQEITDKAYEVRVTCVAGRLFPVRIDAPDGPGRLDWRTDSKRLAYSPICLPVPIRTGILDMLWRLGLVYAAVDLIVDQVGTHWLVDVNPGGQWAWIDCTRDAITTALADLLQKGTL
ncbi:MvdC/MvdD family ATP grasp protein [Kitasatospora sp. NPDC056273]|uniref:MvdC/MvdD family ATP grasp protein n=1 Tax=Kitasatospora sp. NPDC056273 TaxID=3345769 RepID=UPI0035E0DDE5